MSRLANWLPLLVAVCLLMPAAVVADEKQVTELSIDLADTGKPFRGWGTSLAWWANGVGDWPEQSVDEVVHLVTHPQQGLGLNVFRYNIGGGDQPSHHHMRRWGDVPGFCPGPDAPYDWSADAPQRRVLLKLVKACDGRAVLEAFSNSPPWWMTVSGCVSGAANGGANLKPECEQRCVDYLADVVQFYRDRHGLMFDTLEPFNEPDANWWKANGRQEGVHVPRDQQARLIRLTRAALDRRGLHKTGVSAADANSIDDALASILSFDKPTLVALAQVNTHSYAGTKRTELRDAAAVRGKPLWQSESGPLGVRGGEYEQSMMVAQRIVLDINQLRPEVWCTWQAVGGGAWGCLHADPQHQTFRTGKMFHVLAAFTRHIRPGDRFVHLDSDRVVAAVSSDRDEVAIVLVNNENTPHVFRLTLRGQDPLSAVASGVRTTGSSDLVPIEPIKIDSGALLAEVPAASLTCLTIHTKAANEPSQPMP